MQLFPKISGRFYSTFNSTGMNLGQVANKYELDKGPGPSDQFSWTRNYEGLKCWNYT